MEGRGEDFTCGGRIYLSHSDPSLPERLRRLVVDLGDRVECDINGRPVGWGDWMAVLLLEDARLMLSRVPSTINPPSSIDLMNKVDQLEHMTRF